MKDYQFSFEKLEVWQLARQLSLMIYKLTSRFPSEEKYALVSQIRRAIVSVCSNIAEGSTRMTGKDQAHFTTISFSSLMEVYNQLIISNDLGFVNEAELNEYKTKVQQLSIKLSNLKQYQLSK
jgi:four helix bundle protein